MNNSENTDLTRTFTTKSSLSFYYQHLPTLAPTFIEFANWVQSMKFSTSWTTSESSPFPLLEISNEKDVLLVIHAIDLTTWEQQINTHPFSFTTIANFYRSQNIRFVTLWEDVWLTRREIVQSRISALLGLTNKLPARVTKVRRITKQEAHNFLLANHLQDPITAKYRFGLFLPQNYFRLAPFLDTTDTNEVLIAVATFSQPRIFSKNGTEYRSYEMIRFANLLNTLVIGGLDKLLKAFEKEREPNDIMTYADLDWSEGGSYQRLGFDAISDTAPYNFSLTKNKFKRTVLTDEFSIKNVEIDPDLILIKNSGSRKFVRICSKN